MSADFTITSRVDPSRLAALDDLPDGEDELVHDLLDAKGNLIATGMTDADCRIALAARGGPDATVVIKKGALGRTADETTTVGAA
jgi:hypothetical protein